MPPKGVKKGFQPLRGAFAIALIVPLITSAILGVFPLPRELPSTSSGASGGLGVGAVVATIPVGNGPDSLSYDSADDFIFVANRGDSNRGDSLSVIDGTILKVKSTTPLPAIPVDMVYDNNSGELYVVGAQGTVSIIDGSSARDIGNFTMPVTIQQDQNDLQGVTYDFRNRDLYITDSVTTNITVVDTTSNRLIGNISTNYSPYEIRYDYANRQLYALDEFNGGGIIVLNSTTNTLSSYISQPSFAGPVDVTFDDAQDEVFVVNELLGDVWVLNGTTNQLIRSIPIYGYPAAAAYDTWNNRLYVATDMSPFVGGVGNVTVVNVTSGETIGRIPVGVDPTCIALDGKTGLLYISDLGSNEVSVISPNATGSGGGTANGLLGLPGIEGYVVLGSLVAVVISVLIFIRKRSSRS